MSDEDDRRRVQRAALSIGLYVGIHYLFVSQSSQVLALLGVFLDVGIRGGVPAPLMAFGLLLIARILVWQAYRRRLRNGLARGAAQALDRAGRMLQVAGTAVPLALVALLVPGAVGSGQVAILAALAGLAAAFAGAYFKFTLVTRAGFNQGFVLVHLPVRGQPR